MAVYWVVYEIERKHTTMRSNMKIFLSICTKWKLELVYPMFSNEWKNHGKYSQIWIMIFFPDYFTVCILHEHWAPTTHCNYFIIVVIMLRKVYHTVFHRGLPTLDKVQTAIIDLSWNDEGIYLGILRIV